MLEWAHAKALKYKQAKLRRQKCEEEKAMKEKIQSAGRFLSGMIMPNIGAFIAWGLITALFISTGWLPYAKFATLVDPMLKYLLPVLIGYTGGNMVGKQRGAVVGAIATIGVIVGADIPMFLGAMIMGPIGGLCIKKVDKLLESKIPAGFEMLVNNFSAGILGAILALLAMIVINPFCVFLTNALASGVQVFVNLGLLPLTAIFVEPAKVLFLNNAINHGIFTPLGLEDANQLGKSIFFMIESNPGPGLGLLLAYSIAGKGNAKSSAPGAAIIHFLGGIHEVYFPYVMMNPLVILATIAGNAVGIFTLQIFGGGLIAAASPGSIFAELMMTPRGAHVANILGILLSAAVSFGLSLVILKAFGKEGDLEASKRKTAELKAESKGFTPNKPAGLVKKIIFACDAGMGSSAMGASVLRKKLKAAGVTDVEVAHSPVSEVPPDTDVILTHHELRDRAATSCPTARLITIQNFMNAPEYDALAKELAESKVLS
jgi:PTS system mannitol-specific IIC component